MKRDLKVYLEDILENLEIISDYVKDIDEEEFSNSRQLQDAVIRRFEIVGEAAKQVPNGFRSKHPHIPWRKMAGLRDVLIHHYFGVSVGRVGKMIEDDLDKTKEGISEIINQLPDPETDTDRA
ncbi:MAG: DUF86 domain-containing protein [Candidatus Aminicenantes bacterium]|nr:MAG: DUF86 domain-containing protein [Candidatus Aminicenantes bacterium]